jgi:hypothetical protein
MSEKVRKIAEMTKAKAYRVLEKIDFSPLGNTGRINLDAYRDNGHRISLENPDLKELKDETTLATKLSGVVLYVPNVKNNSGDTGGYLSIDLDAGTVVDDSEVLSEEQKRKIEKDLGLTVSKK